MVGIVIYETSKDRKREKEIATILEKEWKCQFKKYPNLSEVDFYVTRDDKIIGFCEIKCRNYHRDKLPTVYMSFRKWIALTLTWVNLNVPAYFVVAFMDYIGIIDVKTIMVDGMRVKGRKKRDSGNFDYEPIIDIPIDEFKWIPRK
jgi:hypothetical protein